MENNLAFEIHRTRLYVNNDYGGCVDLARRLPGEIHGTIIRRAACMDEGCLIKA